jgi:hypothetical protein
LHNEGFYLSDAIDVIEEVLNGGGEFRMCPKGVSMLPLIRQGVDSVVLTKRTDPEALPVRKHEIAFYRRASGQFVLHRVMQIEKDGTYTMCGDNQLYLEKGIHQDQIIGYVSRLYKKDRLISFRSMPYRLYVGLWCWMPFRWLAKLPGRAWNWLRRNVFQKK